MLFITYTSTRYFQDIHLKYHSRKEDVLQFQLFLALKNDISFPFFDYLPTSMRAQGKLNYPESRYISYLAQASIESFPQKYINRVKLRSS